MYQMQLYFQTFITAQLINNCQNKKNLTENDLKKFVVIIVYDGLRNVNIIKIILIDLNAFQKLKDIRLTKKSKHKRY